MFPASICLIRTDNMKMEFYFPALHIRIFLVSASLQMNGRDSSGTQAECGDALIAIHLYEGQL